ncbi:hypothetical protein QA612_13980 [Evansella sp. AB-P1]|uniref:hypothetical protein n=1 Tax=Evansella sp. AB-P1 TaxID=3037653 RepID=UPI00241FF7CA|nr:hypothetical protein [Evansella sp. AB-P1]MDG5788590.1 hypothetical protein [Evansella sp. AB-P1]
MKKIRTLFIFTIVITCTFLLIVFLNEDQWDKNVRLLKKEIVSLDDTIKTINLNEVTPFEWDVVYFFDPYTPKDQIYETVGYKWDKIKETVSEGMNQIVFLQDEKVVAYVYGYPSNNGYGISYVGSTLQVNNSLDFQVTRRDGVIYLHKF